MTARKIFSRPGLRLARPAPDDFPTRNQNIASVVLWIAAVILTILINPPLSIESCIGGLCFFIALHFISEVFITRLPAGLKLGLLNTSLLAAALVIGYEQAILTALVGGVMALPLHLFFTLFGRTRGRALATIIESFITTAALGISIVLSGWLFLQLGGELTSEGMEMQNLLSILAFAVAFFLLGAVFYTIWLALGEIDIRAYYRRHQTMLLITGIVSIAFAPLIAGRVPTSTPLLLLLGLAVYGVAAVVFQVTNLSQLQLFDRINDLRTLNSIGQALNSNLELDAVIEAIYLEISSMLDTSGFYIAIFNESTQTLHFPLAFHEGNEIEIPSRTLKEGLTEHIVRNKETLLIPHHLRERAQELGIEPVGDGSYANSFLGVPIISTDRVLGVLALRNFSSDDTYSADDVHLLETVATQAGIALSNAQLFEQSQRQSGELNSLNFMSAVVSANLDLQDVIHTICYIVIDIMGSEKAAVFLIDEDGETMSIRDSVGFSQAYLEQATQLPIDNGSSRLNALTTRSAVILENVAADDRFSDIHDLVEQEGFRSVLEVPMMVAEEPIGTLAAYFEEPRRFQAHEVQLLQTFSSQVAIAVQNVRLYEQMVARTREIEALYESSTAINASLSMVNVLRAVALSLVHALELDICTAWIAQDDEQTLDAELRIVVKNDAAQEERLPDDLTLSISELPAMQRAFQQFASLSLDSEDIGKRELKKLVLAGNMASGILLPLVMHGTPVGLLMAGWQKDIDRVIASEKQRSAEALANQAAVAIDNARLFERTDVALSRRLDELGALETISRRMTRRLDLRTVLELVVQSALDATDAELGEVALLQDDGNTLRVMVRYLEGKWDTEGGMWTLANGLTGKALRQGEVILAPDVTREKDYIEAHGGVQSELAAPIQLDDVKLGVLNLESTRTGAFTRDHARFITNLAGQAAIAIENARLFERLNQRADQFSTLRSIAVQLLSSPDLNQVLDVVALHAVEYTGAMDVHIYLYDADRDDLTFGASRWRDGEVGREFMKPRKQGLTATIARSGERLVIRDLKSHPLFKNEVSKKKWKEGNPLSAMVGIPLKQADNVVGVFNLAFDDDSKLNDDTLRFLELLASQAAVGIATAGFAEQVRTGRDRLQAILDTIHDGIMMFNASGQLVMANPRLEYLLNVHTEDILGKHFSDLLNELGPGYDSEGIFSEEATEKLLDQLRETPLSVTRRRYTLSKPQPRYIEEMSIPVTGLTDRDLTGRLFILRDATQEYELEVYREDMSNMIVHDLRSPLGGVITGMQLALDEVQLEDEPDLELIEATLEIAQRSAGGLLNLIETILDVNKLEAGEMPLKFETTNLIELTAEAFESLKPTADEAGITVQYDIPDQLAEVSIDTEKIRRVMINLIDNALRYTPAEGTITIKITPTDTFQQVSVIDNGVGIEPEHRERIFERFAQIDTKKRVRGGRGSGLGLTFSRLAVEAHGGRIWVDEGLEGGAAFHFILPVTHTS